MGSGGSFVAILLSVPLTAVALVGVVGVPKLQEILSPASSHGDDEFADEGFGPRARSKRGPSKSGRGEDAADADAELWQDDKSLEGDLDSEFGAKPKSSKPKTASGRGGRSNVAADDLDSDLENDSGDLFKKPARSRFGRPEREGPVEMASTTDPFKSRSPVTTADHVTPASAPHRGDGFAASIERLRGMGVDRFHLEPGLGAGQFLFVCQVEGAGEAGTVHRFEAEAGDPTAAVADVTKQLAAWQAESSVTKTAGAEFRR